MFSSEQHQTQLSELQPSKTYEICARNSCENEEPKKFFPTSIETQPVSDDEWDPSTEFVAIFTKIAIAKQLNNSADVEGLKCFLKSLVIPTLVKDVSASNSGADPEK